jgi:hypothetical protein
MYKVQRPLYRQAKIWSLPYTGLGQPVSMVIGHGKVFCTATGLLQAHSWFAVQVLTDPFYIIAIYFINLVPNLESKGAFFYDYT